MAPARSIVTCRPQSEEHPIVTRQRGAIVSPLACAISCACRTSSRSFRHVDRHHGATKPLTPQRPAHARKREHRTAGCSSHSCGQGKASSPVSPVPAPHVATIHSVRRQRHRLARPWVARRYLQHRLRPARQPRRQGRSPRDPADRSSNSDAPAAIARLRSRCLCCRWFTAHRHGADHNRSCATDVRTTSIQRVTT